MKHLSLLVSSLMVMIAQSWKSTGKLVKENIVICIQNAGYGESQEPGWGWTDGIAK